MEGVSSNSGSSIYYIIVIIFMLAAIFNIFFYTRKKRAKGRRLKSIMSKLNLSVEVNKGYTYSSKEHIIKLTALALFILAVVSVGLCFYIEQLMTLDKGIILIAVALLVSTQVTIFIIRLKINKHTFNMESLPPVLFTTKINLIFSVPMFLTSVYTVVLAFAIPAVFIVSFNKMLYIAIIGLLYILWLIILTAPRDVNTRTLKKHYQSTSASGIIKYYESFSQRSFKDDKATKALVSINKVLAYLFYAEYDRAEAEISKFDWDGQCLSLKFNKKTLLAIKSYLSGNHLDGYKFAHEARSGLKTAVNNHASNQYLTYGESERLSLELLRHQDIITDIGKILSGSNDRILANNLSDIFEEMKAKNLNVSLLIAWCLCKVHADLGEKREYAAMLQYIKENAPNCRGLV